MGAAVGAGWAAGRAVPPQSPGHPAAVPARGSEPPSPSRLACGRRWAAPSLAPPADAPLSPLYLIRRPAAAAPSPAPAEALGRGASSILLPASGPSSRGAGRGARRPGGLSPLAPHLGAAALCARWVAGHALPARLLSPGGVFTGARVLSSGVRGGEPSPVGFYSRRGSPGVTARLGRDPSPLGAAGPRHAKHHAPGHPCPRSSCHTNGLMYWRRWQALHRTA